jgi:hypothetical protein
MVVARMRGRRLGNHGVSALGQSAERALGPPPHRQEQHRRPHACLTPATLPDRPPARHSSGCQRLIGVRIEPLEAPSRPPAV